MRPINHNDTAIWMVIFVFLVFLVGSFVFVQYEIFQLKNSLLVQNVPTVEPKITPVVQSIVQMQTPVPTGGATAVPTIAPVVQVAVPKPAIRITYIPLIGGSTQNTDWTNISGSSFMLSIGDYGTSAYAVWDANLRVDNANGTTFARIFDTTHGITVNGSEISLDSSAVSTDVISSALQFWQGNNSYIIQVKSLNSSTAFVDSGRIKIGY